MSVAGEEEYECSGSEDDEDDQDRFLKAAAAATVAAAVQAAGGGSQPNDESSVGHLSQDDVLLVNVVVFLYHLVRFGLYVYIHSLNKWAQQGLVPRFKSALQHMQRRNAAVADISAVEKRILQDGDVCRSFGSWAAHDSFTLGSW